MAGNRIAIARALRDELDRDGCRRARLRTNIYFLRSGDFVKIGHSRDIERRIKQLRHAGELPFPDDTELLGYFIGSIWDEKRLHAAFSHKRVASEWFNLCDAIFDLMDITCATCQPAYHIARGLPLIKLVTMLKRKDYTRERQVYMDRIRARYDTVDQRDVRLTA